MQRRRAARCRLRASVALEAGYPEDAREALDEARRLEPSSPELAEIEQRIASVSPPPKAVLPPRFPERVSGRVLAGATALVLVMGVAGWLAGQPPAAPPVSAETAPVAARSTAVSSAPLAANTRAAQSPPDVPAPLRDEPIAPEPVVREERASREPDRESAENRREREPLPAPTAAATAAANLASPVASEPPPVVSAPPPAEPGLPVTIPVPAAAKTLPAAPPAPPLPEPGPVAARVSETRAEPAPRENEEPRVRSALRRYEAAYSALNLAAARAVWPTVDSGALGRAFSSLESQRVSLGNCDVSVSGASATAQCAGHASYTPKVGGVTRTEPRRWTFELSQSGDEWHIVRATVR